MTFIESIKTCVLTKYLDWNGRASRSEFWWFYLAATVLCSMSSGIIGLLLFCPIVCATTRRLHDTGRSGWWQLMPMAMGVLAVALFMAGFMDNAATPAILGILVLLSSAAVLIFFLAQAGTPPEKYNPYGSSPYVPEAYSESSASSNGLMQDFCPRCSHAISGNDRFCPSCGISLEQKASSQTCVNCGILLEKGAQFCPRCGQKQPENPEQHD